MHTQSSMTDTRDNTPFPDSYSRKSVLYDQEPMPVKESTSSSLRAASLEREDTQTKEPASRNSKDSTSVPRFRKDMPELKVFKEKFLRD